MGNRRPGTICTTRGDYVDEGTLAPSLSQAPGPTDITQKTYAVIRGGIASLRQNATAALEYMEALPEHAKRAAAYEFFSAFFDHYLPKRFLHQYIYGNGAPLVLKEKEMIDCNPYINVMNCKKFREELIRLGATDGLTQLGATNTCSPEKVSKSSVTKLDITCPAAAFTNGTLGQFSVPMHATLTYRGANDWQLTGSMSFYDEWDFDPKDFSTGGRSLQGEIKTRFAYYSLPGQGFKITSVETDFSQGAADATVVWNGGKPVMVPDKIAQLDVDLKNIE